MSQPSRSGYQFLMLACAIIVGALLTACRGEGGAPSRSTPTAVVSATPLAHERDPRELASYLGGRSMAQDWDAITPYLADEFRPYGAGRGRELLPFMVIPATPDQWDVEDRDEAVVVRQRDLPPMAVVFRRLPDGALRIDLGPHAINRFEFRNFLRERANSSAPTPTMFPQSPNQMVFDPEEAEDIRVIRSYFDRSLDAITTDDNRRIVTVTFFVSRNATGTIPLDGITWSAGDAGGQPTIIWTTAILTDEALVLPNSDAIDGNRLNYTVAFELPGALVYAPIQMRFEDISVSYPGGGEITFALDCTFQAGEFPVIE